MVRPVSAAAFAYSVMQDPVSQWWLLVRYRRARSNAPRALLIGEYETKEIAEAAAVAAAAAAAAGQSRCCLGKSLG